jgi:hypothetical protein
LHEQLAKARTQLSEASVQEALLGSHLTQLATVIETLEARLEKDRVVRMCVCAFVGSVIWKLLLLLLLLLLVLSISLSLSLSLSLSVYRIAI